MAEHQDPRVLHIQDDIMTHYGDLQDESSIDKILHQVKPDEIYNIGAQSHVRISFDMLNLP
jgi:GDPmannose 4,6-dehydratase